MVDFELTDSNHLDYNAFSDLQRAAYGKLLAKSKISKNYISPEFYKWKFHPPAGPAKIVTVWESNQMVSTNSMIPLDINFKQYTIHGWQACDAATLIKGRRKGYSSKCLQTLLDTLNNDQLLFVFPNKASMKYVEKMNFWNKGVITTWVKPVNLLKKTTSSNVIRITEFDNGQDKLANRFSDYRKVFLTRSADYLNWRYVSHPFNNYIFFIYKDGDEQQGFSVIRSVKVMGYKIAVIMELWGLNPKVKKALLRKMAKWSLDHHIKRIIFQDSKQSFFSGLKLGFIAVPSFLLPKKQVLMVYAKPGNLSEKAANNDWWVQLGDWDFL